ncbi:hypothetical protein Tco_0267025 [Tanacetum coccineum]
MFRGGGFVCSCGSVEWQWGVSVGSVVMGSAGVVQWLWEIIPGRHVAREADSHGWSSGFFSMASLASSIFIFIVKSLQFEHSVFPGLSAALEDPEEELAREKEFEGIVGPEKNLRFQK